MIAMKPEELRQAIKEFKEIYEEEFGTTLTDVEATEKAQNLLQLFDCLTQAKKV